jgi:hypothetical protein
MITRDQYIELLRSKSGELRERHDALFADAPTVRAALRTVYALQPGGEPHDIGHGYGCISAGLADAFVAVINAHGWVPGSWTVDRLVDALRATGATRVSQAFDRLFGENGEMRGAVSFAYRTAPFIKERHYYTLNAGSKEHGACADGLAAVCAALNARGYPLPASAKDRLCPGCATGAPVLGWYDYTDGSPCSKCGSRPNTDAFVPRAAAPKVDPYEAHDIALLDRAGSVLVPGEEGAPSRTDRTYAYHGAHASREGARIGAEQRLFEARTKAAAHRRGLELAERAAASIQRAIEENGKAVAK